MKQLISGTTAYSTFANDCARARNSHAYMLHFNDVKNMRAVLKIFALRFFGLDENSVDGKRILSEVFTDCRIYPAEGKKLTADAVSELLNESVMRPVERDKKLFIISGFEQASALLQNKLLKTLEEPPQGVYFLLGATSLAPVLDTVKSRVKTLTIPPFSESEVYAALERKGSNALNKSAAQSCGGIFGVAENMVGGGWFAEIRSAALEICTAATRDRVGALAIKYGDTKYKNELLSELAVLYHGALCELAVLYHGALCERAAELPLGEVAKVWRAPALAYAIESVDKAASDVKFNAFFQGLLYDLMLRIIEENDKWLKLQA